MVKNLQTALKKKVGNECNSCYLVFANEEDLRDHIQITLHKGPTSSGTQNFKYRINEKTTTSNLLKGAQRNHFNVEYKQGATNLDFSDGIWTKDKRVCLNVKP